MGSREINRSGVSILLVERNANIALRVADQAAVLGTGRAEGEKRERTRAEALRRRERMK